PPSGPDARPPTVAITTPAAGGNTFTTRTTPLTLSGTAGDNLGVTQVAWTSSQGTSGNATTTNAWATWSAAGIALQPGSNVLTVTARDAANNNPTATLTVTYDPPDTTPPTVSITTPTAAAPYTTRTTPLTLGGTAGDNLGVTHIAWTNSQGGSGTATTANACATWSAAGITLQPGSNLLTVTATDAASNTKTATLTVTYDPTAPTVSLTAPAAGAALTGTTTLTASAADHISVIGVQFLLDGAALGAEVTGAGPSYPLSWNTAGASNGAHSLAARARDAAGNTTTS